MEFSIVFARNDLPITVKMSVTHSKFYHCPVFERPLVIPDELFTILPLRLKAARGSLFRPEVIHESLVDAKNVLTCHP